MSQKAKKVKFHPFSFIVDESSCVEWNWTEAKQEKIYAKKITYIVGKWRKTVDRLHSRW